MRHLPRHKDNTERVHGAIFIKEEFFLNDGEKNEKMKQKIVPSGFRKVQWEIWAGKGPENILLQIELDFTVVEWPWVMGRV